MIKDPDLFTLSSSLLNVGVDGNIWIEPSTLQITLRTYAALGVDVELNLSNDGASLQAFYSFLKEEWKADNTLIKYDFPMLSIHPEQFEFIDGWKPADTTTSDLFKNGGYAIKNKVSGTSAEEYLCGITLGDLDVIDQAYFQQIAGGDPSDITLAGKVNQCIKIYGDGGGEGLNNSSAIDYRSYFKLFVREQARTYDQSEIADIGVSLLTYQAYRFPLSSDVDDAIANDDTAISTTLPYTNMSITYLDTPVTRSIGGVNYNFDIIIDADVSASGVFPTVEEIYEFAQYSLRQSTDIDAGAGVAKGYITDSLLSFSGSTLITATGVYIDGFNQDDINRIEFYDTSATKRIFPFISGGTIEFNANLVNDSGAVYRMFFTDANGSNFGDSDALLVKDNDGVDISGDITGSSVSFTFDYDGNVQGGRTAGTDANITVVAIGLDKAQYINTTAILKKSSNNTVSLVSSLERNYV